MATHSSTLVWKIPWMEEPGRLQSMGSQRVGHDSATSLLCCFIDYAKVFDCVDHNKLWKILQEMGIPDPLTCLLRHLYVGQEETVRTRHVKMDWLQIGKGYIKAVCCHLTYLIYMHNTSC